MRQKKTATRKMMDLLARRDHSRAELIEKLTLNYSTTQVEHALKEAEQEKWLIDDLSLAQRLAQSMHNMGKGIVYINWKLAQKGLPSLASDENFELEKAMRLVENKLDWTEIQSLPEQSAHAYEKIEKYKGKLNRFLASRGFDQNIVRKVLHEKFRSP